MTMNNQGVTGYSQSVMATHHGKWVVNLHEDGRLEVVEFTPYSSIEEAKDGIRMTENVRRTMAAMASFSKERQAEYMKAQQDLTSDDEAARMWAYRVLRWPQANIDKAEERRANLGGRSADTGGQASTLTGFIEKAKSWIKAEASVVTQGKLPDDQYEARIAACRACEHLDVRAEPQVGFCKACGCGTGSRAELTVKGRMPAAKCPKGKWPALPVK